MLEYAAAIDLPVVAGLSTKCLDVALSAWPLLRGVGPGRLPPPMPQVEAAASALLALTEPVDPPSNEVRRSARRSHHRRRGKLWEGSAADLLHALSRLLPPPHPLFPGLPSPSAAFSAALLCLSSSPTF